MRFEVHHSSSPVERIRGGGNGDDSDHDDDGDKKPAAVPESEVPADGEEK